MATLAKFSNHILCFQDSIGWAAGIGMLAIALAVSLTMFLIGIKRYRKQGPLGSPLTTVAQVLVAAARKWRVAEKCGSYSVYHADVLHAVGQPMTRTLTHTNQLRFVCLSIQMGALM